MFASMVGNQTGPKMVGVGGPDVPDALRVHHNRPVHRPVLGADPAQRDVGDRKGEDDENAAEGAVEDVLLPEEEEEVVVGAQNLLRLERPHPSRSRQALLSWYRRSCHQLAAPPYCRWVHVGDHDGHGPIAYHADHPKVPIVHSIPQIARYQMGSHEGKEEVQTCDRLPGLLLYRGEGPAGRNPRRLLAGWCCCLPLFNTCL